MRKALILLTCLAALPACGGPADSGHTRNPARDVDSRPGNPAVYQRIDGLSDCAALQQEFDTASANHDRAEAGSDEATTATAYMEAAQARMGAVGC